MAKPPTLQAQHNREGASWTSLEGYAVPLAYGHSAGEHRAVTEAAGVFDRSYRGLLAVRGAEAAGVLHRLFSSRVADLAVGAGQEATFLTAKGKLVGAFRLWRVAADEFLLLFAEPLRAEFARTLAKYTLLSDLELVDLADSRGGFSVEGPAAAEALARALEVAPGAAQGRLARVPFGGVQLLVLPGGESPEGGYDLVVEVDKLAPLWEALCAAARAVGGGPVGFGAAETLRVEAGIGRFGADFDGENFPNEAGLERALDYSKCYVGQEVVARIRTYGHANRALAGLRARRDEPIAAGAPLRAGDAEAGRVTSAVRSPRCGAIALGMVRRQFLTAGTELQVAEDDSARTEVEVVRLPFVGGAPPSSA